MNTSRNLLIAAAAAISVAAVASSANAQSSATGNGTASVTVLTPLTVANGGAGNALAFGKVIKAAGNVTISSVNGNRGGSLTAVGSGNTRAQFIFTGEGGQSVNITVPTTVTLSNGASSLTANLTDNLGGTDAASTGAAVAKTFSGTIGSTGTVDVGVGGTLTLAGTEATGAYTGSFAVIAAYN